MQSIGLTARRLAGRLSGFYTHPSPFFKRLGLAFLSPGCALWQRLPTRDLVGEEKEEDAHEPCINIFPLTGEGPTKMGQCNFESNRQPHSIRRASARHEARSAPITASRNGSQGRGLFENRPYRRSVGPAPSMSSNF